nr:hypothetical protein [Paenibacillus qinlingensis]
MDGDNLAGYTEDHAVMAKIKRSYHFEIMARYYRDGELVALQYRIPSERKRSARNLFEVDVLR